MKPWWQSKTIWAGVLEAIIGIAGVISQAYPEAGWAVIAVGIATVILRVITSAKLTTSDDS